MSLVKKILVANRGEIACRIIRTAKRLGVESVAIYSDIDRNSKFVDMADQAYRVGTNLSAESYLNKSKIMEIALDSHCEALHPGFGFLSENAGFAKECVQNGIIFIGPPPDAITAMGSKSESKKIMTAAGVPVVPGYHEDEQDSQYLFEQASKIGYPVLIKAVSGGGGKGMRIVRHRDDFLESLESCKRQSLKSFSDDRVIIERYITKPRHIEVQIFGDQQGNYVHLFERDCSIQRRHQKVVEEAPSNIPDTTRQLICKSAVEAAKAVGYYNAGTVEFIFDLDSNQHYFMEMNTRLQVEHPISQMITGFDFVEWQLLVASKLPLPKKQAEIDKKGNAVQVRIYAQDPFNSFLPGSGKLRYFRQPEAKQGVRIETGVRQDDTISTFYDPMIAKLITYGATRNEAIDLMKQALADYRVVGLNNNLKFLKRVISDPIFRAGTYDTSYIEKNIDSLLNKDKVIDPFEVVSAVIARTYSKSKSITLPRQLVNFRNVKGQRLTHLISVHETSIEGTHNFVCQVEQLGSNHGIAVLSGKNYHFEFTVVSENVLNIIINGQVRKKEYTVQGESVYLFDHHGDSIGYLFSSDVRKEMKVEAGTELALKAPMPGIVTKVYHRVGDRVKKGQSIVAIEAMKMELVLKAEFDCTISKITAVEAEFVEAGKVLVELVL